MSLDFKILRHSFIVYTSQIFLAMSYYLLFTGPQILPITKSAYCLSLSIPYRDFKVSSWISYTFIKQKFKICRKKWRESKYPKIALMLRTIKGLLNMTFYVLDYLPLTCRNFLELYSRSLNRLVKCSEASKGSFNCLNIDDILLRATKRLFNIFGFS